ncbi:hypothetical protein L484_027878 [Morus notabilis]|uniref:Essential protein Yae1 N-terminal domain-containing protein n=1 Tax=Morus notabilis TaxID=981085 RepID=W9SFE1_9ROSA|nr:putative tRNA 2'-phosphotransferase [Morus notabilis]EXC30703.1 hypothetical protein L484_027878 [Morus notabilis]
MKEGSFAEELYSESLKLSNVALDSTSSAQNKVLDFQDSERDYSLYEDDSFYHELEKSSDLDREWQRRREQFHTIGYRDGVIAGKEAAAQEGFNIGFKQSVSVGYKWGIVRGVTSALALLPDGLKEKLIETEEKRTEFQKLYESAHSLSTTDALKRFNDSIVAKRIREQGENVEASSDEGHLNQQRSDSDRKQLDSYYEELQSLLLESPRMKIELS